MASAPSPAPAPAAAGIPDMFGGMSTSAPAPALAPAAAVDPFASVMGSAASAPAGSVPDVANLAVPAAVATACSDGTRSSPTNAVLGNDSDLYAGGHTVMKASSFVVVAFLASTGAHDLSDIHVKVTVPPCYKMAGLAGDPVPRPISADTIDVGTMPIGTSTSACLAITLGLATAPAAGSVNFQVSYKSGGTAATPLAFSLPITMRETLRATSLDTNGFGSRWGTHGAEHKVSVRTSATSIAEVAKMCAAAGVNPIQVLTATSECIASGALMGTPQVCLVHLRFAAGACDVTVRSMDAGWSGAIAAAVQSALA